MIEPPRPDKVHEDRFLFKSPEDRVGAVNELQLELGCPAEYHLSSLMKVEQMT